MTTLAIFANMPEMPTTKKSRKPNPKRQKWFLREWRNFRGLTQEKLAAKLGISRSDISNWENKRRYHQDMLERLARALNLADPGLLVTVDPSRMAWHRIYWTSSPTRRRVLDRLFLTLLVDEQLQGELESELPPPDDK